MANAPGTISESTQVMQARTRIEAVSVTAPARLHLGFLDLHGGLGRRYGSIGLAVDGPATELVLRRANDTGASGPEAERAQRTVGRVAELLGLGGHYRVDIARAIPAHAGLGSGTQMALAIGTALARIEGLQHEPRAIGEMLTRGARSAIGMAAFECGGFVVDGGRGASDSAPPVLMRAELPPQWRILLVLDPAHQGVHGDREIKAFAALPEFPEAQAGHLCRLVLMRLMPSLVEKDLAGFATAVTEIQAIVGAHFASAQGGSPWSSPAVGRLVARLADEGAVGIGQSSWGPTGFAFTATEAQAHRLYSSFVGDAKAQGLELLIVRGRNTGARIELGSPASATNGDKK